jgi:CheY-like chemotaxis protein
MTVILIAEDNADVRTLLHRVFDRAGFTVLTAVDGRDALHAVRRHRPDVVLTDLDMPHLDGLQLCRAIRQDPTLGHTPVTILSGGLHPGDPRTHGADVCHVLLKPFNTEKLVAAMRQLVDDGGHDHRAHPSPCPGRANHPEATQHTPV